MLLSPYGCHWAHPSPPLLHIHRHRQTACCLKAARRWHSHPQTPLPHTSHPHNVLDDRQLAPLIATRFVSPVFEQGPLMPAPVCPWVPCSQSANTSPRRHSPQCSCILPCRADRTRTRPQDSHGPLASNNLIATATFKSAEIHPFP